MKRILLFFLISFISVGLRAQPLTCSIKINNIPLSHYDMCVGDDDILNGTPSGGTSPYTSSWTGGGSQLAPTNAQTATFTATNTGPVTIVYHVTDAASNTSTDTIVIDVHPLPNLFTSGNQIICLGSCIDITALTFSGDGLIWYQDFIGGTVLGTSSGMSLTVNICPTVTTDYYAMAYIAATGCIKSKKVTITVVDLSATASAIPNPICFGDTSQLHATPIGGIGPYTYSWSPTLNMSNPNIANPLVWPPTNTSYTVSVTDLASSCVATASVTITVNPQQPPVIHNDTTLCFGSCVNLTVTGSSTNFDWSTGINGMTINVCPVATTTYTVTMTDVNGCTATDDATVTINPQLTALAGADQFLCYGNCFTLGQAPNSATGGTLPYSYSWASSPGSFTSTVATPNVCPTVTTTYTLTVTDASGCTASDNVVITVNPHLIANAGNPPPLCLSGCATIGGTPTATGGTAPYNYDWSPSTGLSCTNCANPFACPAVTTTYFLTVTDAMGCTATAQVTVIVNQPPTAEAGNPNPQTICSSSSVTLGGSPTASGGTQPYTYSWTSTPGSFTSTSPNPSVSPTVTTTYNLTVTDAAGCTSTDNVLINVNPVPIASAGPPQIICYGTCVAIGGSPTASGGTPPYTYNWSPGGTLTPGNNVSNPTACPLTTTTYNVTVTDAVGCTALSSVTITVNTATATAVANPSIMCQGACSSITATGGGTYQWSSPPGGTTASISACPAATTTYTVTVTAVNGCTATATATVNVLPVSVTATPTTNPLCNGQCTDITAVGSGTYQWSNPPGGTNATINVCPVATTTYTVTITAANGCTASSAATIIVNSITATAAAVPASVCQGGCSTITATGGGTYNWSNPPGGSAASISVCPAVTSTYTVTVTGVNGCTASASATVTINIATATAIPAVICVGQCANITANGGVSFQWNTVPVQTTQTINVCPLVTTQYCVTVTDINGCTASACATVTVNSVIATASANPSSICQGGSSTLTATGGGTYLWCCGLGTNASVTVSPATTTTYTVTVTNNGCSNTASVTVIVNTLAVSATAIPNPICNGGSATITAAGGGTYLWCCGLGTGNPVVVTPAVTTTYSVTITNGCTASTSVTVTVNTATATVTASPPTVCAGNSSTLTATGGGTYLWSSGATTPSITVTPGTTSTYCVTVTALNGCTATACGTVTVNPVPVAAINPSTANICTGTSATLTASGGGTYQWCCALGTNASVTVSPMATTTYTVTVTNNGCTASTTAIVNVVTTPVASISTSANPLCAGLSTTLTASGGNTYQWSNPPGGSGPLVTVTPAATTTYTVTVSATGCSAASTASVTITVNPVPAATLGANPNPVCNGASVTLTAGGGTSYTWSNPPGGAGPVTTDTPIANTTYTVTVSNTFNCSATASVSVNVNTMNATVTATPPTICQGQSTTLTATGGGTYLWCCGLGNNAVVSVSPASTTTYTVTVTAVNLCTQVLSLPVNVNPAPVAAISASSASICAGTNTTLTASGGGTYTWCCALGNNAVVTVTPGSTTTYTVTVTGGNGCASTATSAITVTPIPTITLTCSDPDHIICQNQCVTFTATGATIYSFFINGILVQGPGGADTYTSCALANNAVISVTGSTNGCPAGASMNITVDQNPTVTISSAIPPSSCGLCDGSLTEVTSGGTNPGPPQWSTPPGGNTATISNLCSGMYSVTVTDANGCFGQASAVLNDPNSPTITLTSSDPDNIICAGDCPVFTANGAISYEFYINTTSVQGPGPQNTYMACNLQNGDSVYVEGVDLSGCIGFTNVIHNTVDDLPLPFTVTGGGQFCQGGPGVPVGLNGSQVGVNYQLFITIPPNPPVFAGTAIPGTGAAISFPNQSTTGTFTVTAINPLTSCQNNMPGSAAVSQNPPPSQFTVTGGGVYCAGGNGVPVGLSGSEGPLITYQLWIDPGTGPVPDTTLHGNLSALSFGDQTTAGIYTVIATNTVTTCTSQMIGSVSITTSTVPTSYAVTGGGSYCGGGMGALIGLSGSNTGVNYQLSLNGVPYGVAQPGTGGPFDFGYYVVPGTYTVLATNSTSTCSNIMSGSATVSINPAPTANAGPDQTICQWAGTTLNGSGAGPNGTYHWAPSTGLGNSNISNPAANPMTTTTYFLTVTDANGCTAVDNVAININPFNLPVITASDTGFCIGTPVSATLNAGSYASYIWNTTPVQTTQTINITATGHYVVTVTAANSCSATDDINIINYPPMSPPVILADGPTHFCQPDSVKLYLNNPYYTYEWSSGSINVPQIWVAESRSFYVTVTDSFGCVGYAGPLTITVDPLPHAVISWVDTQDTLTFHFYSFSFHATSWSWTFDDISSGVYNWSANEDDLHKFTSTGTYTVQLITTNNCGNDTDWVTIVVHQPFSGVPDPNGEDDISLYPNPAIDLINVDITLTSSEQLSLTLGDALGRQLYVENLNLLAGKHHNEIDVSGLPTGMYFLRLEGKNTVYNKKIVKN